MYKALENRCQSDDTDLGSPEVWLAIWQFYVLHTGRFNSLDHTYCFLDENHPPPHWPRKKKAGLPDHKYPSLSAFTLLLIPGFLFIFLQIVLTVAFIYCFHSLSLCSFKVSENHLEYFLAWRIVNMRETLVNQVYKSFPVIKTYYVSQSYQEGFRLLNNLVNQPIFREENIIKTLLKKQCRLLQAKSGKYGIYIFF